MRKTIQDLKREEIAGLEKKNHYEMETLNYMVAEAHKRYQKVTKPKIQYPIKFKRCCKCNESVKLERVFFIAGSALSNGFWIYHDLYGCKKCFQSSDSFLEYAMMEHLIPIKYEYLCRQMNSSQAEILYSADSEGNLKWEEMFEKLIKRRKEIIKNNR